MIPPKGEGRTVLVYMTKGENNTFFKEREGKVTFFHTICSASTEQ